jgi:hypothetical protein
MYTTYTNFNEWNNLAVPEKGRKFVTCDIPNKFKFTYWIFVPKELENNRGH